MEWIGRPAARLFSSEWGVVGRRLVHVLRRVLHFEGGYLQGRVCCNPHTPPPASHLYFHAKDVGVGFVGTYEGDHRADCHRIVRQKKPYASRDFEEIGGYLKTSGPLPKEGRREHEGIVSDQGVHLAEHLSLGTACSRRPISLADVHGPR